MIIQDSHQGLDISPRYILFLSHFLAFFSIYLFFTIFLPANPHTFFISHLHIPPLFLFFHTFVSLLSSFHPPFQSSSSLSFSFPYYILFLIHPSFHPLSFFLLSFHPHMFPISLPVLPFSHSFRSSIHPSPSSAIVPSFMPSLLASFITSSLYTYLMSPISSIYSFSYFLFCKIHSEICKINSENPFQKVSDAGQQT